MPSGIAPMAPLASPPTGRVVRVRGSVVDVAFAEGGLPPIVFFSVHAYGIRENGLWRYVKSYAEPSVLMLPLNVLSDELVFAELMRAAMESFASENGARLAAMESAHGNIQDKIEELSAEERQTRQDQITMELLDVITGSRATTEDG